MDYTINELKQLPENSMSERQLRRRCKLLQSQYPDKIKRTSNRKWLIHEDIKDEVIQRKNQRIIDSLLINSGKHFLQSEYITLEETLNEIRQEYDKIEWMFFAGFRPKYNIGVNVLFNMINSLSKELKKRTKSNVTIFYAIEKDDKGIYHVHMAIKGSHDIKSIYNQIFMFKFNKLKVIPFIQDYKNEHTEECYEYFSKEYYNDDKMRIGIIKK